MNIALWVLQALLALHTVMGAGWKFFNPPQTVPSLAAIPQAAWLAMSVVELLLSLGLVLPALGKPFAVLAPIAALCIAAEMLLLCGVGISSATPNRGQITYWLVVAVICAFIAYGRFVVRPL